MKKELGVVVVLAVMGTFLFSGISLADICPSPGCVSTSDLTDRSVSQVKLKFGSVGRGQIRPNAVNGAKVADNSLTSSDILDAAGADFVDGNQLLDLTVTVTTVRSVTITAPASGVVIVSASGYFFFNNVAGGGRCSITTGSAIDFDHLFVGVGDSGTTIVPFGATRGFAVGSGSTIFRLVCEETNGDVTVVDSSITAIYVPERY